MAKFIMEDGSIGSYDQIMKELQSQRHRDIYKKQIHVPEKTIKPVGDTNRSRLLNMNLYDMLCQISDSIDECIIDAVTGKRHSTICPKDVDCRLCLQLWLSESKW